MGMKAGPFFLQIAGTSGKGQFPEWAFAAKWITSEHTVIQEEPTGELGYHISGQPTNRQVNCDT